MRAVIQRVRSASVEVDGRTVGAIGPGSCVLVGVTHDDDEATADALAERIWHLRIFDDEDGVMNVSLADSSRTALIVSQFTLYGSTDRGRRPSWTEAAPPDVAEPLVARVVETLRDLGAKVATGVFGARMRVELVNDGPVTIVLER